MWGTPPKSTALTTRQEGRCSTKTLMLTRSTSSCVWIPHHQPNFSRMLLRRTPLNTWPKKKSKLSQRSAVTKETISFKNHFHKLSQTINRSMFIPKIWNHRENNTTTKCWLSSSNFTKTTRETNWITNQWSLFKTLTWN